MGKVPAMKLADELVDVALMVRGIRSDEEAFGLWSSIMSRLGSALGRVERLQPNRRRMPDADGALDWLHRSIQEAPLAEDARAEASALIGELKRLVGVVDPGWRPSPPPRRKPTKTGGRRS
jgi:hypothetical protein